MIRLILVFSFLLLFLILGLPVLFFLWIWEKKNKAAADLASLRIVQWAFKVILFLSGTKITVIGEEKIPKNRAVLYIANHQSYFDILVTYSRCPGLTGYISKDFFKKIPILSIWMKRLHCLFLNRADTKEGLKTILKGIDLIRHGISVCIFPEGTRNEHPQELLPFKDGSFKLSSKTGCPIVPIAITNSCSIFENHLPFIKKAPVILQYGEPILPEELDDEEKKHLGDHTKHIIEQMLAENEQFLKTP
ncbi:MAG: 1-acyl-sn-glycerol-3-phosphate acyltransferase [Lachnospiraceae bacterium]|nr:1-acyl-sn-glycerol-3-phosphate acyltransferase [Lachnospiraceae bacterium]